MTIKEIWLSFIEKILSILGKDSMQYKLQKYRLYGAKIGGGCRAFSPISSSESYLITIGDNVTIATNVRFITHDNSAIKIYKDATDFVGPITIGNNVFIGAGSIILPGISIADDCIIGAGSIVCKSITIPGSVIAGNPARIIGTVTEMQNRYGDKKFNFSDKNREKEILDHPEKWIQK